MSATIPFPAMLKRAEELKQSLIQFATEGHLKEDYEQVREEFFGLSEPEGEHEAHTLLEWFLYDWVDDYGEGVIEHFVDSQDDLSEKEEELLLEWTNSINSIFEIKSLKANLITLKDLDSEDTFTIATIGNLKDLPFKKGEYLAARILPLGEQFIFAGAQFLLPDKDSAMQALAIRQTFETLNDEEGLEEAQQEQREAFIELFGKDEISIAAKQLPATIGRFQRFLFLERKDPETGKTAAQLFEEEFGRELKIPELPPIPHEMTAASEVTILCDEFEGILILPEYQKFKQIFTSKNRDKEFPGWKDLLWNYIKEPSLPIVAFERIAEEHPKQVEKVMRDILEDKNFSIEHLYAALLHYKHPAEGFEDMEDEELLWDLFNGNEPAKPANAKSQKSGKSGDADSNVIDFNSKSKKEK
ncbi:MAG: hypothetical protein AB1757_29045 [Acidobacteriota bacterium]